MSWTLVPLRASQRCEGSGLLRGERVLPSLAALPTWEDELESSPELLPFFTRPWGLSWVYQRGEGVCTPFGHWCGHSDTGSYWEAGAGVMPCCDGLHLPCKPAVGLGAGCPPALQHGSAGSCSSAADPLLHHGGSPLPAVGRGAGTGKLPGRCRQGTRLSGVSKGTGRINQFSGRI